MLNHIVIMGRLTRDPELRRTGSGTPVASFTVACDRDFGGQDGQKEVDFIDCVAWRQTGEFVSKWFDKGQMIVVDGRLQIRTWKDKEGNNRRNAEVVADHCYFGGSKAEGSSHGGNDGRSHLNNYGGYYLPPQQEMANPAPAGGYQQQSFGGYPAPSGPADYGLLDDDDAQLPF